ncbi:twin-arginine translocation signal domain-containing protein [Natrialba swarupiae]|nr:twin-arginine translocation signal domain-containing protein [Natrialba swarupiae]
MYYPRIYIGGKLPNAYASNDSHGERAEIDGRNVSRRRLLQATGVAGVAGFAGCVSETEDNGNGGGNRNGGDDGEIGTVTFGVLSPVSGGFSPQGGPQRQGAETAVEYINESDEFDFEIEAVYEDTETEPSVGRRRAQRVVEETKPSISSVQSTRLSPSRFRSTPPAKRLFTSGGAAMELTEECNAYTFRNETNTAQQASGLSEWILEEGYENVWIHTADYAYGNSAVEEIEASLEERTSRLSAQRFHHWGPTISARTSVRSRIPTRTSSQFH